SGWNKNSAYSISVSRTKIDTGLAKFGLFLEVEEFSFNKSIKTQSSNDEPTLIFLML
ncbi:10762_t:CDS:1, partial [Gigaspora rosea]